MGLEQVRNEIERSFGEAQEKAERKRLKKEINESTRPIREKEHKALNKRRRRKGLPPLAW